MSGLNSRLRDAWNADWEKQEKGILIRRLHPRIFYLFEYRVPNMN